MSGNNGWIKLHRKLLDSPVWANANLARFWIWCLLRASHNEFAARAGYSEIALEPGEFVYTHGDASAGTGLTQKVVRTCLDSLGRENDPLLGRKRAGRYTVVTILKWRDYQIDNDAEGRKTGSEKAGKGQGLLIGSKKIKKHTGVSTASDPTEAPTWKQWVAACRAAGRKDPAPSDGALKAAETLVEWVPELDEQRRIMDAYLTIDNGYLRKQGYQLANLTKYKFEEARAIADGVVKTGVASAGDAYELTGDSLAAAIECANLFGRPANE